MAKRKQDIFVEQKPEWRAHRMVIVTIAPYLLPELEKIDGCNVLSAISPDRPMVFISPLYDWDEVIAEIENLGAPIPEAFLETTE